ncbi:hypothetical protein FGO68_gene3497 [Halteria grandinella]|uniref:Uncharacterized protein n=1 Tax=Halteria grandinella TaxID=5974 RepID=A0A8J8T0N6_HALGN|nr:hypothetical protein FGO68_gene3497 [Halteria grandinella]
MQASSIDNIQTFGSCFSDLHPYSISKSMNISTLLISCSQRFTEASANRPATRACLNLTLVAGSCCSSDRGNELYLASSQNSRYFSLRSSRHSI